MRNVLTKTLYDKRGLLIGWCLGLTFFGWLMTIFYPSLHDSGSGLVELAAKLPPAFAGLIGNLADMTMLNTYLGSQLFDIRMPLLIGILSILLGVSLSVGDEEKGGIRTVSALPISRRSILLQKWAAVVVIVVLAQAFTLVGILIGLVTIHESLDAATLLRLGGVTALLAVALATLILCIGLASGKRSITMGVGVVVAVGSFILTTFARSIDWLKDYEKLSLFHYFPAVEVAKGTVDLKNILVYGVIIIVALSASLILFTRRDIK